MTFTHVSHRELTPLFEMTKPQFIVEVGSFIGGSAIQMGQLVKKMNLNATILCIDTWLGTMSQWLLNTQQNDFMQINGRPTLYEQFMMNIMHNNLSDIVVPFSAPSSVGLMALYAKQYKVLKTCEVRFVSEKGGFCVFGQFS